ncbi:MAG TPA: P-II family nitrogen regulator [Bacillota bacterium]
MSPESGGPGTSPAFDLIVTIVNRGFAEDVVEASRRGGAEGGTIVLGRGTGIHEQKKILGIPIEPEKELVLTVTPAHRTASVLEEIRQALDLDAPGHGIGFVVPLKQVVGIAHLLGDQG